MKAMKSKAVKSNVMKAMKSKVIESKKVIKPAERKPNVFEGESVKSIIKQAVEGVQSDKGKKLKMTVHCVTSRAYDRTRAGLKGTGRPKKEIIKIARRAYAAAKKAPSII